MKRIVLLASALFLLVFQSNAQVFYTESFDGTACPAGSGCDPSLVGWTVTNTGANGATPNHFYVSCTENGNAAGQCGSGCGTDQSLHIGNDAGSTAAFIFCPSGDCGAAYDDSGPTEITNIRAESPVISCAGQSNITISFVYMETGENLDDDASLWYNDGTTWAQIDQIAKSNNAGCSGQGKWTAFTASLPASANNNPNVKIGFVWKNDGDGVATDPSFAVDDIELSASTTTPPVASFTASSTTICEGDCINFTNTSTGSPFTATNWTFTGASTASSTSNNPTNICYPTAGTYTVSLSVTNANGSDTETQTNFITVNTCTSPPSASFTASSTSICEGDCINFTNTSTGGPFTATNWTFTGASTASSSLNNPTNICYPTAGTYAVSLSVTDAGGSDTETQNNFITVNVCTTAPVAAFSANSTTVCVGDPVIFTDNSTNSPSSWNWTFTGGTPSTSTSQNPTVTYATPGTYAVSLTVSNAGGSDTETQTNYITVITCSTPVAAFTPSSSSICAGDCITFTNTSTSASAYVWSFTGGTPNSSTNQNPGTICYNSPGTYTVQLIAANGSGADTTTTTITVGTPPSVTASADTTIDLGNSVPLTAIGSGSGSYSWSPSSGLSCSNCANPNASPTQSTSYIVTYTEGSCSATDTVNVFVNIIEGIGVPNAFTPNGDGVNDVLFVQGQGIVAMQFIVYNRFGQQVFKTTDQSLGWDGTHNGKEINGGVFVYYLEYTLISGATGVIKGDVTLRR
jgi:gliding motility-associated-like protein